MKRFFVFTLIALFAAAGLAWFAIADSDSDSDEDTRDVLDGDGEGYVGVTAWYDGTYAKSVHQVSLYNNGNVPIRYYYDFSLNISGPEDIPTLERDEKGWVAPDNSIYDSQNYSVKMSGKKRGRYSVSASSSLSVKVDINNDDIFDNFDSLSASASSLLQTHDVFLYENIDPASGDVALARAAGTPKLHRSTGKERTDENLPKYHTLFLWVLSALVRGCYGFC